MLETHDRQTRRPHWGSRQNHGDAAAQNRGLYAEDKATDDRIRDLRWAQSFAWEIAQASSDKPLEGAYDDCHSSMRRQRDARPIGRPAIVYPSAYRAAYGPVRVTAFELEKILLRRPSNSDLVRLLRAGALMDFPGVTIVY